MGQNDWFAAKGPEASRLRREKYKIVRAFGFPEDALPGAITRTFRRCGKPTCHCAKGKGHPLWVLSFSIDGSKHTEVIPEEWVAELEPLVAQGREHREALAELLRLNARLLRLRRQEKRLKASETKRRNADLRRARSKK